MQGSHSCYTPAPLPERPPGHPAAVRGSPRRSGTRVAAARGTRRRLGTPGTGPGAHPLAHRGTCPPATRLAKEAGGGNFSSPTRKSVAYSFLSESQAALPLSIARRARGTGQPRSAAAGPEAAPTTPRPARPGPRRSRAPRSPLPAAGLTVGKTPAVSSGGGGEAAAPSSASSGPSPRDPR